MTDEQRGEMYGRREEDRNRIDREVSLLRMALASAVTMVVMLIASWATHSVTQEELNSAILNEDKISVERFDSVKASQEAMRGDLKHVSEVVDDLQVALSTHPERVPVR